MYIHNELTFDKAINIPWRVSSMHGIGKAGFLHAEVLNKTPFLNPIQK